MKKNNEVYLHGIILLFSTILLSACGGGGGGSNSPTTAASPILTFSAVKTFSFNWEDISKATHYKLLQNPDGNSGFSQLGNDIAQGVQSVDHIMPLYDRIKIGRASCRERVSSPV